MTIEQFGQTVKAKYPAYASRSDLEVGQAMLTKYPTYQSMIDSTATQTKPGNGGGFLGALSNVGLGAANQIFKTGIGLGQLATKGLSFAASRMNAAPIARFADKLTAAQEPIKTFFESGNPSLQQPSAKVGSVLADVAMLAEPNVTQKVSSAKGALKGLNVVKQAGEVSRPLGYVTAKIAEALPEAALGTVYGATQGQTAGESLKTGALFGVTSVGMGVAGDTFRSLRGSLEGNVGKALGMTGRMNAGQAVNKIAKSTNALRVINKLAPDIKVSDANGIIKPFEPTKATFAETVQAFNQAKNMVYNEYSGLATQAGDQGAVFKPADFYRVIDGLKGMTKDSTSATRSKVGTVLNDIVTNFTKTNANGARYFADTDFPRIQKFIEQLNVDVNPLSDKAGAEVSGRASQLLRGILDEKIGAATGEGYQALRNSYADLKSIEMELVNQFKKAARNQGIASGFSSYVEGYGGIDTIVGLITGHPMEAVRGGLLTTLGGIMKKLRDPEVNLRNAFRLLQKESGAPTSAISSRLFGEVQPTNTGNQAVKSLRSRIENQPFGLSIRDVTKGGQGGATTGVPKGSTVSPFKGFTDLSTKTLEKLKGRSTVSKQFISDLTNAPDMKQAERDAIRNALKDEPGTVNVKDFANKVKTELLPLDTLVSKGGEPRYESIALPDELRGPVANYYENIYQSPIKTSAGDVHFGGGMGNDPFEAPPNYFAHTRVEDLPATGGNKIIEQTPAGPIFAGDKKGYPAGSTRRVIELQSDLFQKGGLETHTFDFGPTITKNEAIKKFDEGIVILHNDGTESMADSITDIKNAHVTDKFTLDSTGGPSKGIAKLEPYRNTWHERIIREEVKQAAKDGKTVLQFPTGETAMKIEGLGSEGRQWSFNDNGKVEFLRPQNLKPGLNVSQEVPGGDDWVIADVLGDGKFKAMQKKYFDEMVNEELKTPKQIFRETKTDDSLTETFDISGKVDQNNPIYKFYEKEVGKYLRNKYGATQITDPQGVTWWQLNVPKEAKNAPVEAFGAAVGLGTLASQKPSEKKKLTSLPSRSLFITKKK